MKITKEISLYNFDAWSGGRIALDHIIETAGEAGCDRLEQTLDELYPDGIDETTLNDILWFDTEWCYEVAGVYKTDEDEE